MNKQNIVIFGAGNTSRVVIDIIEREDKYKIIGIINKGDGKMTISNYEVLGDESILKYLLHEKQLYGGIVGPADNYTRFKIVEKIKSSVPEFNFITAIHPNAVIAKNVSIGLGTYIMAGVVINSGAKIGNNCLLNTKSSFDHDSQMDDFSSLAPGVTIGGSVKIGKLSAISLGANVINDLSIGESTVIGCGATVTRNMPSNVVAYGVPCRVIRSRTIDEKYF